MADTYSRRCHCSTVTYRAEGLCNNWFCHCHKCRRVSEPFFVACRTEKAAITATGEIRCSPPSGTYELGRCTACGGPLFWRLPASPTIIVHAGSLADTYGLETRGHIFVAEKGDYYTIELAQWTGHPEGRC